MSESQNNGAGFDYLTAGTQPSEKGVAPAQKNTLTFPTRRGDPDWLGRFEITVSDLSQQGYNHPEGDFSLNSNGFAWSTLVSHRPGELVPPPKETSYNPTTFSADYVGIHSAYAFGTFFMGLGDAGNVSLLKETSATDPTPTPVTYSPGGGTSICSLTRTVDSGAERLLVGRVGAAAQLLSDASGTVAATMDSSTNSLWGCIPSGINATDAGVPVLLMYAGTSIKTKASNASMTTALVATVPPTTVNAGGFAIGRITAKGRAERAYWAIPRVSTTAGALKFTAEKVMDVCSTSMEGTDFQVHTFDYLPDGIIQAAKFRNGILMISADGEKVVYWDGQEVFDLGLFRKRVSVFTSVANTPRTSNVIDSDEQKKARNLIINGPECGVVWQWYDLQATAFGYMFIELYNFEAGSWHNFGNPVALQGTAASSTVPLCGGAAPLSPNTHRAFVGVDFASSGSEALRPNFIPPAGNSLLWQHSQGSAGTSSSTLPNYDDSSRLLGCRWWLDGIKRRPKVITEVEFNGNLDHGGTAAWTFQVQVFGSGQDGTTKTAYDKTFAQGGVATDYIKKNTGGWATIYDVQLYLIATANTSKKIPQLLPFTIRGLYSKDGRLLTEAEAGRYA